MGVWFTYCVIFGCAVSFIFWLVFCLFSVCAVCTVSFTHASTHARRHTIPFVWCRWPILSWALSRHPRHIEQAALWAVCVCILVRFNVVWIVLWKEICHIQIRSYMCDLCCLMLWVNTNCTCRPHINKICKHKQRGPGKQITTYTQMFLHNWFLWCCNPTCSINLEGNIVCQKIVLKFRINKDSKR